ncbi:Blp family class II bacteriocin [Streptococcus cuniculipharyngis]|uniref:Bacteriocin n=1 Tax=Streptococcus cuniculipharyngis TaxID=1562651 RepID=A0A5C5SES5_9STRE|nr:Blp family class II bacteriocin [Streptococcus cuniculipharyngis]TWS98800.1 bacteriocin [Streptococcus cuniculipharyngis]
MNTKAMEKFEVLDIEHLETVEGGKNNWQYNVLEGVGAAICTASGVGAPLVPACGYIGAKFGVGLWAGVTKVTGGF